VSHSSKPEITTKTDYFELGNVLLLLVLALQYLWIWIQPGDFEASDIFSYATLMAFEFVMVHSGTMMAFAPRRYSLYALVPIYGLFAWGFSASIDNNVIVVTYLAVVFNRMRFAFSDASEEAKNKVRISSVFAAVLYFVLILFTAIGSNYGLLPELGLHSEFLEVSGYNAAKTGGGLFVDLPHTAIGMGFLYYLLLALTSLPSRKAK